VTGEARRAPAYRTVNRRGWNVLSRTGLSSSRPYGPREFAHAREMLDPQGWLPWGRLRSVLCLASGGGQQGPLFASLGLRVTVADLAPGQLALDRAVARRNGLDITCVQADMLDLSALRGNRFDLVYQPVSAIYVPDVGRLYREVATVLPPGGLYRVQHWNPVQMQLPYDGGEWWDGEAYRLVHPHDRKRPQRWEPDGADGSGDASCLHWLHTRTDLFGGLCDTGFVITRFREHGPNRPDAPAGTWPHLAHWVPPFLTVLARRTR
jgi:SAM-dependent methyltransferase